MSDLQNMADLVSTGNQLLDDIRGGAISRMAHEHQAQQVEFKSEHDAKQAEFAQAHNAQMQQHDAAVASRRAAVDALLQDQIAQTFSVHAYYDGAIHGKSSLNIVANAENQTISDWVPVPLGTLGEMSGIHAGALAYVKTRRCYSASGGYPDYLEDKSRTYMQFIMANDNATSQEIDAVIAEKNISLNIFGTWGVTPLTIPVDIINIADKHSYKRLYVRFKNVGYADGEMPQNIIEFGGGAHFSIDEVTLYPKIAK
ncbi:hypothetical protein [Pseudoalteromonas maricaloris]|uniref:hypothetical protein n=1 Tax=Pseudoalteromonas maricaloris TaxID=184924 RepID=UPI000299D7D7|nr:hypothetical protein [Pseudoalteromonas flavipulchra]